MKKKASELIKGDYYLLDGSFEEIWADPTEYKGLIILHTNAVDCSHLTQLEPTSTVEYITPPDNKKCAFFENRICDDSCMAYFVVNEPKTNLASCKRMVITIPTDKTTIF